MIYCRVTLVSVLLIAFNFVLKAQSIPQPIISSPNVASLGVFGEIPVGLFTGVPDISIPLHVLEFGNIKVPLVLKYHPSSVVPSQHPGWVGLGWGLQSNAVITRRVRGMSDEACVSNIPAAGYFSYYPSYLNCSNSPVGSSGSDLVNVSNWDDPARLANYFIYNDNGGVNPVANTISDVQADEFSFSYGEYSGKFYYAGTTNGWKVISDKKVKVELDGFLYASDFAAALNQYKQFSADPVPYVMSYSDLPLQPRAFKGFILTLDDGTKLHFGGLNGIEFTSSSSSSAAAPLIMELNTWLLTKVVDCNKNEVNFEYRRNYPSCSLGFGLTNSLFTARSNSGTMLNQCSISGSYGYSTIDAKSRSRILMWSMYLSKISSPYEDVTFDGSISTALQYSNNQLTYPNEYSTVEPYFNQFLLLRSKGADNIQWEKLDAVNVKRKTGELVKKIDFKYSNTSGTRLTLNSIEEKGLNNPQQKKVYDFSYNDVGSISALYDGNFTDHWGFFNNKDAHAKTIEQLVVNQIKDTDPNYVTKGLLTRITYPTKGYSLFSWEPHDYSKVVANNRLELIDLAGTAGGSRISRVQSYLHDGSLALDKKYYYKRSFSNGSNLNSLSSSGVLNGLPQYRFSVTKQTNNSTAIVTINLESINSLAKYSYAGQGSYIGYDEVTELNSDNSYTRNFFTNYGKDINDITHFDSPPVVIGWKPAESKYFPMSSLEQERGKLAGVSHYKANNTLVKKKTVKFRTDPGRFNDYAKIIDFNASYGCSNYDAVILAAAVKDFNYEYYPVNEITTTYDEAGTNPVVATIEYEYNLTNFLSKKIVRTSQNITRIETYKYPSDYIGTEPYTQMAANNILRPLIETIRAQVVNSSSSILDIQKTNYFEFQTGRFYPQNIQVRNAISSAFETRVKMHSYDTQGNILSVSKGKGPKVNYVWSYNGKYPIGKIENADLELVKTILGEANMEAYRNNPNPSDSAIKAFMATLRNDIRMADALVTTYTYSLFGNIASIVDPKGMLTVYEYDDFLRLKLIRDHEGIIEKKIDYQYKN